MSFPSLTPRTRRALQRALAEHQAGDVAGALVRYRRILDREPGHPVALHYGALACHQLGRSDTAVVMMLEALRAVPEHADSWFNLGKFYHDLGDPERAGMAQLAALEHDPMHGEALVSAGDYLWDRGEDADARRLWDRALLGAPRSPEAAHYRSFVKLRAGDPSGWDDYEARWRCALFAAKYRRAEFAHLPEWPMGVPPFEALAGQTVLLHGEQGHGDQIQMLRYVRWVSLLADHVVVEVLPALVRLARASFPDATVIARGEPVPEGVTLALPTMSLPSRFGGRFPGAEGSLYLVPPRPPAPRPAGAPPRVGIVWAGSAGHSNDRARSVPVETLAPLWAVPGVEWVSLQVGDRADEAPPHVERLALGDFADTAAAVQDLDLVIAVDTATAHLAGAASLTWTWLLLPRLPDYRWRLEGERTPWYPTVRLYRQPVRGDWASVLARVAGDLEQLVQSGLLRGAAA